MENNDTLLVEELEVSEDPFTNFDEKTELKTENQEVSCSSFPYTLKLRRSDFDCEKEFGKFIKSCERLIRYSPEYKIWTEFIRESLGYTACQITGEMHSQTGVDIHHHPFTLWSIVKSVINKKIEQNQEFCSYDISAEVIQLHYDLKASFCLLVSSLHQKYHNGYLQLPMSLVRGDYRYLIDNYLKYLDDDDIEGIMSKLSINRENCGWRSTYTWIEPSTEKG